MKAVSGQENSPLPNRKMIRIIEIPTIGIEVMVVKPGASEWALDIIKHIDANEVLDDRWESRKIRNRVAHSL